MTKGEIRKETMEEMAWRGCEVWIANNLAVPGRKFIGRRGCGDLSGIVRATGIRCEIEIKTIGDRISDDQREFMRMIKSYGGWALLATEENGKLVIKEFPTI